MAENDRSLSEKLTEGFHHDSNLLMDSISTVMLDLEKGIQQQGASLDTHEEKINQAFRDIHSLKSEAQYLGLTAFTSKANDIETILEDLRRGRKELSSAVIDTVLSLLDDLKKTEVTPSPDSNVESQAIPDEPHRDSGIFDDFERHLILEARERGEKIYRMVCEIDESESMKYPRIYLLINNLELLVNVIKIIPDIEDIEKTATTEVVIYFSSGVEEKSIYDAVNIDQIRRIQIGALEYSSLLGDSGYGEEDISGGMAKLDQKYTRIETERLDDLLGYLDEIHFNLHRMGKNFDRFMNLNAKKEFSRISALINEMESVLKSMRMEPFSREMGRLPRLVRDTAGKLDKKVDLHLEGGDVALDRRLLDIISDPLLHLVRNSVDHGIENPDQRKAAEKPETGSILVRADVTKDHVIVQVVDDGKGIDPSHIEERARELGLPVDGKDKEGSLFSILSHPGFSTLSDMSDYSGRGVGLDLVAQRIGQIEGADIRMVSVPGEGTLFTITVPKEYSLLSLIIVKSKNLTLAIPKRSIDNTVAIDTSKFSQNEEGILLYNDVPVFTVNGRVLMKDATPEEHFGLILSHLGSKGCLLVDELLFEKEVPEDTMSLGEETGPHLHPVTLNNRKTDFYFLNPSLIV